VTQARQARQARTEGSWLKLGFVAPTLLFLITFNVYPLFYNIVLSFTNKQLSQDEYEFVGTRNYHTIFDAVANPKFGQALRTTASFVLVGVVIELLLGFSLALAMQRKFRAKPVVLTVLLIPMMLSPAVMGLFWNLILSAHNGVLNQTLSSLGLPTPHWLTEPSWKLVSVLMVDIWMWTPYMMLIALAGLHAIPGYIYEAAEIDRASRWTVFRRITLPMCAPLLLLAVLFRATDALKQFDLVMALTGPNDAATQTLSALLYQLTFGNQKVGLGSAYACVVLVMVIALASVFTRYLDWLASKRHGVES
jgi:multiple sugar transport system permease protein